MDIEQFKDINLIISEINDSEIVVNPGFNNLYIYNDESEIYLKFNYKQVILSKILLGETRKGYGTKILNVLIEYCKNNSIKELMIESVLTQEMANFCFKYGFKKVENDWDFEKNSFFGNYVKTIDVK